MDNSKNSYEEKSFQLPFDGLGISLECCELTAQLIVITYFEFELLDLKPKSKAINSSQHFLYGYEMLLTYGLEIRGR